MNLFTHLNKYLFSLSIFLFIIDSSQAQSSYLFYAFSSDPITFNRMNDDGSNPLTIYTTTQINKSAADGSISKVYFYESISNIIYKADYDGSNRTTVLTTAGALTSIAAGNGYVYYSYSDSPYSVRRCNSDGSNDTLIYLNPSYGSVRDLAFDASLNYLYCYEYHYDNSNDRIFRTNESGGSLTTVYDNIPPTGSGSETINGLAAGGGYIFFSYCADPWTFNRQNSDGTNQVLIYTPPTGSIQECAYDATVNKVFFYEYNGADPKVIYKSDIDGSNRVTLLSGITQTVTTLATPTVLPNANPSISVATTILAYTENAAAIQIDETGTLSDSDGDAEWNGGKLEVQITANNEAADEISISDTDGDETAITISGTDLLSNGIDIADLSASSGTVTNGIKLTITFDADATNASVQEVLQSIRYRNTSDNPGTSNRTITFTATDKNSGSASDTRTISVSSADNDAPTITTNNGLTLNEGATATLTTGSHLSAADVDDAATALTFTVTSSPSNGQLENTDNSGVSISNFTQQNLLDSKIRYVHDGTNTTSDSFVFKISDDGGNELTGQTFNITVTAVDDDAPTISTNTGLTLNEGATKTITIGMLEANDTDTDNSTLTYTITAALSNGQLENSDNPGVSISSFTQQNISDGKIQYVHDGTNTTSDNFTFKVADGTPNELTGQTFSITVTAVDDDTPTISTNTGLALYQGSTKTITTSMLEANDTDTDNSTLTYTITALVSNGRLENSDNPGVSISSFTQQNLLDSKIRYVHDGTNTTSDSFTFKVADGTPNELTGQTFSITVNPIEVSFNSTSSSGLESVSSANLQVDLSATCGSNVTVNYTVTGTATGGGTDYTLANGTLTITAGNTTANITIAGIVNDLLDENNETVIVTLSNPSNAILGANTTHTYTINDNDATPSVAFNSTSSSGLESVSSADLQVDLSAASGLTVTVDYAVTGTATGGGTDYILADGTLTINTGDPNNDITIAGIVNDLLDENNETVIVTLSNPSNATLGANTTHTYTITDNDPTPSVAFNSTSSSGLESVNSANLQVNLSTASGLAVTVDYVVTGTAIGGGTDYTLANGTLTINAGDANKNITISGIVNDLLDEDNETVIVTLSNPTNATLGTNTVHTYTITDDDNAPSISVNDASVTEGDGASVNLTFTVSLSTASGKTITVDYATTAGTATAGTDFTAISTTTLTFTPDQTSKTVNVSILGDLTDEPTETLFLNLSNASNASSITDAQGDGLILDNDPEPSLSIDDVTVTEGNSGTVNAVFTVTLSAVSAKTVTVDYATQNNTALSGSDYTSASGTLTFSAETTTRTITVTVNGDVSDEVDETYYVNLSGESNATISDARGIGTITDDDGPPNVTLSLTNSPFAENGGTATVTATLSAVSEKNATIYLGFTGTANNTTDYTRSSESITINAGLTTGSITLTGVNDTDDDDNETVIVDVTSTTNCTESSEQQVTATITDDENPEISITGNGNNISDGSTSPLTTNYTDFGNTDLTAGEVTHTFTITNSGIGALHLTGTTPFVTISGHTSDFTVISAPTTPVSASSGTTTFSIKFDPTTTGLREATISIDNDDEDENPFTFDIQGTGGNYPEIKVEYSGTEIVDGDATPAIAEGTDFGYDHYNYSAYSPVHTFQIVNQGSGTLNLSGTPRVTVTGVDFSLEQDAPTSIAAGDTAEFKVKFAATAVVARSGNVSITNNDSGENPYNFSITGTGYTGSLMIVQGGSPQQDIENGDNTPVEDDYTDFGRTTIDGGTIDRIFEIENYGNGNLTLSGTPVVIITGADEIEFTVTDQSSSTIGSGSNDTFTIQFDPSGSGTKTATVSIANNDPNKDPYTFTINGDGGTPPTGQNETITINEDETHTFAVSEFTFNDTDGDTFAGIKIESLETAGELKYNGTDVTIGMDCPDVTLLLYTPEFNENASPYASFTYKLQDDQGVYSDIAYSMTINVNSVIDPPVVVVNSGISVNEGGMIIISDANLKSNDSDGEVSALNYEIKSGPFHGVLNSNGFTQNAIANGEVKYTHDGTEAPVDSFMFVVKDNDGGVSEESTFLITVVGINDPPVFTGVTAFTMNEDEEMTLSKSTLLGYVSDPDDPDSLLSVSFTSCCEYMHVSQSDNNYLVTCTENWCGIGECKISVSDGEFTIDTTVNITVNEVNDLPVLTGLPAGVEFVQNGSATIDLNGTASDIETPDSLLVFSFMAVPDSVNTTFNNDTKILTLTSFGGFTGSVLLTITVTDEDAGTAEEDINVTVHSSVTGIERLDGIPEDYTLYQNYPNPFNPVTKIRFGIPEESEVSLRIYDVLGREVTTLINSTQGAGYYNYNWNATNNASGIYFYVLTARSLNQDYREIKKMLLIK